MPYGGKKPVSRGTSDELWDKALSETNTSKGKSSLRSKKSIWSKTTVSPFKKDTWNSPKKVSLTERDPLGFYGKEDPFTFGVEENAIT